MFAVNITLCQIDQRQNDRAWKLIKLQNNRYQNIGAKMTDVCVAMNASLHNHCNNNHNTYDDGRHRNLSANLVQSNGLVWDCKFVAMIGFNVSEYQAYVYFLYSQIQQQRISETLIESVTKLANKY